jgi:hypothetical protein
MKCETWNIEQIVNKKIRNKCKFSSDYGDAHGYISMLAVKVAYCAVYG